MAQEPAWWTTMLPDALDPITLEPLAALEHPPFELRADLNYSSASDWFDGRTLGPPRMKKPIRT